MKNISLNILIAAFMLSVHSAHADSLTIGPSGDTWMLALAPDNNMGGADNFAAGFNTQLSPMRALIRFNLSSIPTNATVTSAVLTLTVIKADHAGPATYNLHRVLKDWNEGVGTSGTGTSDTGAQALDGETTWTARIFPSTNWTSAGASSTSDASSTISAFTVLSNANTGNYTWGSTANMVSDVQVWVNNTNSNFGWLFKDALETSGTARRWASRENATASSRPSLVVNYTVPSSSPQRPTLSQLSRTNNQIRFSFNAEANRTYAVEARGVLAPGSWTPLTNYTAPPVSTNLIFSENFSSTNKFYRVRTP
jgi:hypothetical protein